MKLEINATTIASPANADNFICTEAEIITDTGFNLTIKLVDGKLDHQPVDRIDAERCAYYGKWEATFWRNNAAEPFFRVNIGNTQLMASTLNNGPEFGLEVYVAEGTTVHDSVRSLLSITVEKLLMPLPYEGMGHVISNDCIELAHWMIENNLVTVTKTEIRATRIVDNCKLERLWTIRVGSKPVVRQTLISYNPQQHMRQTMLIEAKDHVYVNSEEYAKLAQRHMYGRVQQQSLMSQQQLASGGIPANHPFMHVLQYLKQTGFSQETIQALHNEALKNPALMNQFSQPVGHPMAMNYTNPLQPMGGNIYSNWGNNMPAFDFNQQGYPTR